MEGFKKSILNIPNVFTIVRIILIIPFVFSVIQENYFRAGIVLLLSGLSDFLDGFFARKFNLVTKFGKILDPVADKLTLIAVMACTAAKFKELLPFMIILIVKELLMLVAGAILLKNKKRSFAAKWYGKAATVFFYFSIITIIWLKAMFDVSNVALNVTLMIVTALLMLFALIMYFLLFLREMKCKNQKSF